MAEDERRRKFAIAEIEAVQKRGNDQVIAFRGFSASIAKTAIRSAFVLNGGAMFAGLAFLGALMRTQAEGDYWIGFLFACLCFVVGITSAALCALFAYLNYEAHAAHEFAETELAAISKKETYYPEIIERNQEARQTTLDHWNEEDAKQEKIVTSTQKAGVGFAVASYLFFMTGCIIVGVTMATA